ncbi:hypothetical protein DXT87_11465 [Arthrobacter sp. AET 35A]|nr:hypothetical protein [Arthrobacter sp. AET 35A]
MMASKRWVTSIVMVVATGALMLVAVPALFLRAEVLNTDRYVETVAPLAADPVLQAAIAEQVTNRIAAAVDVEQLALDALTGLTDQAPRAEPLVEGLAPVIADQAHDRIDAAASWLVTTPEFEELWITANREAHQRLVGVLTGQPVGVIGVDDSGAVTISTGDIISRVKDRLMQEGVAIASRIPEIDAEVTIFQSPELARAGRAIAVLDRGALILAFLVLALAVGAVRVAPPGSRRRAVGALGFAITVVMAVLALGLALGRAYYLNAIESGGQTPGAAERLIDILLSPLQTSIRVIFAGALVVVLVMFLAGRSPAAQRFRGGLARFADLGIGRTGAGQPARWQHWLARYRRAAEGVVVVVALAVLVLWPEPTVTVAVWAVALVGITVLAIELLARPAGIQSHPSQDAPLRPESGLPGTHPPR